MPTDEETFLDAFRANPAELDTWLVLADWLEERGDKRADLLRLQLELLVVDVPNREAVEARMHRLLRRGVDPIMVKESNSIGMELVLIRPGEFLMGSPDEEDGRRSDEQQHPVKITQPFYMGVYEVTRKQYYLTRKLKAAGNDIPVHNRSWDEALNFCRALSEKEGKTYFLPTEAQWEFACRAGTTTPLSFGKPLTAQSDPAVDEEDIYRGLKRDVGFSLPPVGRYGTNPWGLCDMHGNVWEWCADWYDERYYDYSSLRDPPGPNSGYDRVIRGGSRHESGVYTRSAYRNRLQPTSKTWSIGFRVCRKCE